MFPCFSPTHCGKGNVMDCILKNEGWKWEGMSGLSDEPLSGDLQNIVTMEEMRSNCTVLHHHGKIKSKSCDSHQEDFICLKSAKFFQQNQVIPDFTADNLTCPDSYPEVPGNIQMVLFPDQPELMCPGEKVKYECNSGGINVRQVSSICLFKI